MTRLALAVAGSLLSAVVAAADTVKLKPAMTIVADSSSGRRVYTMTVINMPVSEAARRLSTELKQKIEVEAGIATPVSLIVRDATEERLLEQLAERAGLRVVRTAGAIRLQRDEATVTIDVKDANVRDVLERMRRQCGIRNLVIDPDVRGTGTFLFHAVPCSEAFRAVLATQGLAAEFSGTAVATVSTRR